MNKLFKTVKTDPTPKPPKIILYGAPGCGKTTLAAYAKDPIVIDVENGLAGIRATDGSPFVPPNTGYLAKWGEISPWLEALTEDDAPYGTVVVDTANLVLRRMVEAVSGSASSMSNTLNASHGGYGKGRQVLENYFYQKLLPMFDCMTTNGKTVILICHERQASLTDSSGVTIEKSAPKIDDMFLDETIGWADAVLHMREQNGQRVLVCQGNNQEVAKNRYSLPDMIVMPDDRTKGISCLMAAIAKGMGLAKPKSGGK